MDSARSTDGARRHRRLSLLSLLVACVSWATLPSAHAGDKVKVKTMLTTSAELNPNRAGRPSPVELIMFQLKSAEAFENADYFSLADPAAPAIAGDVIERTKLTLKPGEAREFEAEFDEEARFVGFVASFRDIENATWRDTIELPQKGFFKSVFSRTKLIIAVDPLVISASLD